MKATRRSAPPSRAATMIDALKILRRHGLRRHTNIILKTRAATGMKTKLKTFFILAAAVGLTTGATAQERRFGMGPTVTPEMVAAANTNVTKPMAPGPGTRTQRELKDFRLPTPRRMMRT